MEIFNFSLVFNRKIKAGGQAGAQEREQGEAGGVDAGFPGRLGGSILLPPMLSNVMPSVELIVYIISSYFYNF